MESYSSMSFLTAPRFLPLFYTVLLTVNNIQLTTETIPLSLALKLSNIKSNEEFLQLVASQQPRHQAITSRDSQVSELSLAPEKRSDRLRSSAADVAEVDGCRPRGTPVAIPADPDPNVFYWPPCVNVSRCGGCCSHEALACTAIGRTMTNVTVYKLMVNPSDQMQTTGEVTVQLEAHTACDCECRVKPTDCDNRTQRYDPDSCSCRCLDESGAATCQPPKHWDPQRCDCVCQKILYCLDDEYFNYGTCTCQKFPANPIYDGPSTTVKPQAKPDPCARYHCRSGLKPTNVSGQCMCLPPTEQ